MNRRKMLAGLVSASAALLPVQVRGQHSKEIPRIGYLSGSARALPQIDAWVDALSGLGYVEGKTIIIEWRLANGQLDLVPAMAADLAAKKVDVIVAATDFSGVLAQKATRTIPIVVIASHDGVASGLYGSIARPNGNITGVESLSESLEAKRLEILKQLVPNASRLAVLLNPEFPAVTSHLKNLRVGAEALAMSVLPYEVRNAADIDKVFGMILRDRPDAILNILEALINFNRRKIVDFALANSLPMTNEAKEWVQLGQLFSYGASLPAVWRRGAYYVDRILKGANPGDLPVEQPTMYELAVNLKTAKALGITVPISLLARADEVIE
jgi:putative ABC transport system substrate-binding protein